MYLADRLILFSGSFVCPSTNNRGNTKLTTYSSSFISYNFKSNIKIHFCNILIRPYSFIIIIAYRSNTSSFIRILRIQIFHRFENL